MKFYDTEFWTKNRIFGLDIIDLLIIVPSLIFLALVLSSGFSCEFHIHITPKQDTPSKDHP